MKKLLDNRVYFAQNREDLIIEAFFPDLKNGFYVDVGACHPDIASVTKRFYQKGWHGINIEPQTNLFNLFVRDRKRDINLNIGISEKESTVMLRSYVENQGLSTMVDDIKAEHESTPDNKTQKYEDIKVELRTLEQVLIEQDVKSIQFLKVDVEGLEYEVLAGNNWAKFRPEVICIEANHIVKDWRSLLKENDYEKVFFDGLNDYYFDKQTDRADNFDFVEHVVVRLKGGIAAEDYQVIVDLQKTLDESVSSNKSGQPESIKALSRKLTRLTLAKIEAKFRNG